MILFIGSGAASDALSFARPYAWVLPYLGDSEGPGEAGFASPHQHATPNTQQIKTHQPIKPRHHTAVSTSASTDHDMTMRSGQLSVTPGHHHCELEADIVRREETVAVCDEGSGSRSLSCPSLRCPSLRCPSLSCRTLYRHAAPPCSGPRSRLLSSQAGLAAVHRVCVGAKAC